MRCFANIQTESIPVVNDIKKPDVVRSVFTVSVGDDSELFPHQIFCQNLTDEPS